MDIHRLRLGLYLCSHTLLWDGPPGGQCTNNIISLNLCILPSPSKMREATEEMTLSPFTTLLNVLELMYQKGVDACSSYFIILS